MKNSLYFDGAKKLTVTRIGEIRGMQDGAIYGGYLFRFSSKGLGRVYDAATFEDIAPIALDKCDILTPHSNSVSFSGEFWQEGDEFPILYSNLYNTYSKAENRMEGMCCAYRVTRQGTEFTTQLLQVIRVDFVHDGKYWCSENAQDVRPYGNFVVDAPKGQLHAFVMRDESHTTRYFRFALPKITAGVQSNVWGVPVVALTVSDISRQFDGPYIHYMQGATCQDGILYSVEGFHYDDSRGAPGFRVVDTNRGQEVFSAELAPYGLLDEPEFIEIYQGRLYYSDTTGAVYQMEFEN